MIIKGHGIQLDTEIIKQMELHESRSLVVLYYARSNRRDLGELKISFTRSSDAVNFYEKVRASSEALLDEVSVTEFSMEIETYYYDLYVQEEIKLKGSNVSYSFK